MKKFLALISILSLVSVATAQISSVKLTNRGMSRTLASDDQSETPMYCPPVSSMYIGGTSDYILPETGLQIHPAGVKLDWDKWGTSGQPSWIYGDLPVVSASDYTLALKFPYPDTDYALYNRPVIEVEDKTYSQSADIMVCGRPDIDGLRYGMLPFDIVGDGTMVYTADYKGSEVPIFGYGKDVDDFWRLYTAGGKEDNLSHIGYAHLTGIINGIIPTRQPLVMYGAWLYAVGAVADDVELTCSVYSLDDEGAFDKLIASKSVKGSEFVNICKVDGWNLFSIPFTFDTPLVLDEAGTRGDFYAVMVSGFHADGVEYFAPLMQKKPNPYEFCFGFYKIDIEYNGNPFEGLSFVASHNNDDGEMYCAFALNIDAEYPWLACEDADLKIVDGVCEAKLESFYPASDLKVTMADGSDLPSWLKVEKSGRFSDTQLTFTATEDALSSTVDVLVSNGAVSIKLHLTSVEGISDILMPGSETFQLYDLMGRPVQGNSPGIYIQHRADQNRKVVIP